MTAHIPIVSLCVVRVLLVWKPIGSDEHFLSKVPMAKMVRRFHLQDPLNIFHMKRVNKYCTSPINNPITSSLSVDNAWVKQTIYASASIFTVSTAIVNLVLVRRTPLNTKHRRGGRGGGSSGGAGERGRGAEKSRDGRFFWGLYIFTHSFITSDCIWRNKEGRRLRGERIKDPVTWSQSLFVLKTPSCRIYRQNTVLWRQCNASVILLRCIPIFQSKQAFVFPF